VDREADGQALVAQVFGGQAEILMGHGAGQADDGGKALVFHGSAPGGGALCAGVSTIGKFALTVKANLPCPKEIFFTLAG
jgi:hypothetical protein